MSGRDEVLPVSAAVPAECLRFVLTDSVDSFSVVATRVGGSARIGLWRDALGRGFLRDEEGASPFARPACFCSTRAVLLDPPMYSSSESSSLVSLCLPLSLLAGGGSLLTDAKVFKRPTERSGTMAFLPSAASEKLVGGVLVLLMTVLKDESDTMAISPFFEPRDLGRSTRLELDVPLGASSSPEDDEDEAARVKGSEASWALVLRKLGSVGAACKGGAARRAGDAAPACLARADPAGVGRPLDSS